MKNSHGRKDLGSETEKLSESGVEGLREAAVLFPRECNVSWFGVVIKHASFHWGARKKDDFSSPWICKKNLLNTAFSDLL